jgi:hypothetical protein
VSLVSVNANGTGSAAHLAWAEMPGISRKILNKFTTFPTENQSCLIDFYFESSQSEIKGQFVFDDNTSLHITLLDKL